MSSPQQITLSWRYHLKITYLKVRIDVAMEVGIPEAYLLEFLSLQHKTLRRDTSGYFEMEYSYVANSLRIPRKTFARMRQRLVEHGYIDYIEGTNLNVKPRYKVLK